MRLPVVRASVSLACCSVGLGVLPASRFHRLVAAGALRRGATLAAHAPAARRPPSHLRSMALSVLRALGLPGVLGLVQAPGASAEGKNALKERSAAKKHATNALEEQVR